MCRASLDYGRWRRLFAVTGSDVGATGGTAAYRTRHVMSNEDARATLRMHKRVSSCWSGVQMRDGGGVKGQGKSSLRRVSNVTAVESGRRLVGRGGGELVPFELRCSALAQAPVRCDWTRGTAAYRIWRVECRVNTRVRASQLTQALWRYVWSLKGGSDEGGAHASCSAHAGVVEIFVLQEMAG